MVVNEWSFGHFHDLAYASELWVLADTPICPLLNGTKMPLGLSPATVVVFKSWLSTMQHIKWKGRLTEERPLWLGTALPQVAAFQGFRDWGLIGISSLGHVVCGGILKSFSEMQEEYDLHKSQFYKYLQLRHALTPYLFPDTEIPEHNPLEAKILLTHMARYNISNIYRSLIIHSPDTFEMLRAAWTADIPHLTSEGWGEALQSPREASIASQFRLIQLKYLHRVYFQRERLQRQGLIGGVLEMRLGHG